MIYRISFKRNISDNDGYILKNLQLPIQPNDETKIDDGTGDDLEFSKPTYCIAGVPNGFQTGTFLVNLKDIYESDVSDYELKGWTRYVEPEPEE